MSRREIENSLIGMSLNKLEEIAYTAIIELNKEIENRVFWHDFKENDNSGEVISAKADKVYRCIDDLEDSIKELQCAFDLLMGNKNDGHG